MRKSSTVWGLLLWWLRAPALSRELSESRLGGGGGDLWLWTTAFNSQEPNERKQDDHECQCLDLSSQADNASLFPFPQAE